MSARGLYSSILGRSWQCHAPYRPISQRLAPVPFGICRCVSLPRGKLAEADARSRGQVSIVEKSKSCNHVAQAGLSQWRVAASRRVSRRIASCASDHRNARYRASHVRAGACIKLTSTASVDMACVRRAFALAPRTSLNAIARPRRVAR